MIAYIGSIIVLFVYLYFGMLANKNWQNEKKYNLRVIFGWPFYDVKQKLTKQGGAKNE